MTVTTTIKALDGDEALAIVKGGGAFVDMRPIDAYLDVHIPESLALLYESGPGFAARARDCLPLELHLVLLDAEGIDSAVATAALRGKGFDVVGSLHDGINEWARHKGTPASTEVIDSAHGAITTLHVGDPGAVAPEGAVHIPIERLYSRVDELGHPERLAIASGYGVRAALAVGILERHGIQPLILKTRRVG